MKAILLAAGMGTRLYPLTIDKPKCLVEIGSEPLLGFWIKKLVNLGISELLINTHYLHEQVEDYIIQYDHLDITLDYEPELLGTAGTLIKNKSFFDNQDGLMIHADNYSHDNLHSLVLAHQNRPKHCEMTMLIFESPIPEVCGIVEIDNQGVVKDFKEKPKKPISNLANGAIYVLSSTLINRIGSQILFDFSTEVLPDLVGKIYTYKTNKFFTDIGNIESYELANKSVNQST